jgi:hypothetical protein
MPDILAPVRPTPPANEAVIGPNGDRHSQAWTQYHKSVSDWISAQGVGATDGSEATAGDIGEFQTISVASGGAHGMTTFTAIDVTFLDLPAGDWDVWGNVCFVPGGTTTCQTIAGWISPASATLPGALEQQGYTTIRANFLTGGQQALSVGRVRLLATTTTRVYLSALAGFAVSFMNVFGTMNARRQR